MIEKSSLEQHKRRKNVFDPRPWIAFLAVFASLALIFLVNDIAPFGSKTVFMSDLADQYAPYLVGLKNKLLDGSSLSYSFGIGMGKNALGIFAYYLASPLNILVLAFPASHISEAVVLLIMLKLSFAGAFMTAFLSNKFRSKERMCILFGVIYALSAYPMTFALNFIWLDGFALLPLIILLTERFREDRKVAWKLLLALVVLMVSNYYMAYIVGIFSFLYLLGLLEYEKRASSGKIVGWFILTAVSAAMVSAAVLVPAGLDTLKNGDNSSRMEMNMEPSFPLRKIFAQFFPQQFPNLSNNLPVIYSSLAVVLLVILLFCNRGIPAKLKARVAAGLGFAVLSFVFRPLDLAWQLFNAPNWFMHRYSFLLIFGMVLAAYYSFLHLKTLTGKGFATAFGIFFVVLAASESLAGIEASDSLFFQNLLVAALIAALLFGMTKEAWPQSIKNLKRCGSAVLVLVISVEVVILAPQLTVGSLWSNTQKTDTFASDLKSIQSLTDIAKAREWGRVEQDGDLNRNIKSLSLSAYTGTNGIGSFCTMSNKQQHHFLKQMGYRVNYNYFALEHFCLNLPSDSVLGVRYILSKNKEIEGLTKLAEEGEFSLYENPFAANIAMLVPSDAMTFEGDALEKALKNKDYFLFQELWFGSLTGKDAQALFEQNKPEFSVTNAEETKDETFGLELLYDRRKDELNRENTVEGPKNTRYYLRKNDKSPIILQTEVTVEKETPMYFVIPFQMYNDLVEVYCNGEQIYSEDYVSYYSVILSLGCFKEGEKVELEIRSNSDVFASYDPIVAYLNLDVLDAQMNILNEGISDVHVSDGKVDFRAEAKEGQILLTSIPYEEGWTVRVDGQKVGYSAYQDAFISFPVTSGTHVVEMRYDSPGQKLGVIISAAGLLLSCAVVVFTRRKPEAEGEVLQEEQYD